MAILKTKKTKILSLVLCAALAGSLVVAGVTELFSSKIRPSADITIDLLEELETEYAFGDTFVIPECTFTKEGESVDGVPSLQYPDGTQTGDITTTLNQSGNYVLRYKWQSYRIRYSCRPFSYPASARI